jgi:hypothetical protein
MQVSKTFQIQVEKLEDEKQLAFGWLYQCKDKDGNQIVDHSKQVISEAELENATYNYVLNHRHGKDMHSGAPIGRLVECIAFTEEKKRALGLPDGALPTGTWIGMRIDDPSVWQKVKSGERRMFSLGGRAIERKLT